MHKLILINCIISKNYHQKSPNNNGRVIFSKWVYLFALQLTQLELQLVSPKLLMCRDLELAVPGTYNPNQPIVRIQRVQSSLQVITSKQRPRKLMHKGDELCPPGDLTLIPHHVLK